MAVRYTQRPIGFSAAIGSICDEQGALKLYTNGVRVLNKEDQYLENGFRINPGPLTDDWVNSGSRVPQAALILPHASIQNNYHLIYAEPYRIINDDGQQTSRVLRLHYALADFTENTMGVLVEKDFPLIVDTLDYGKITACRHGNGRDWWVFVPYVDANEYHRFLLNDNGIEDMGVIRSGDAMSRGVGQAKFSPDGTKFINYSAPTLNSSYLTIYDFDRCSGLLSNPRTRYDTSLVFITGIAISENSHFAYESARTHLYQYDLTAADILGSRSLVAEYDGYYAGDNPDFFWTTFALAQLAPDGRIFISNSGSALSLHIIQAPNKRGLASRVEQHVLDLPDWTYRALPNYPYFGLGPWDGSPCDTLGIDSPIPKAAFEYTPDSLGLAVSFFDASHFADSWMWNFGDESPSSNEQHPTHTYTEPGVYQVCLHASNTTGSDLYCDTFFIGSTNTSINLPVPNIETRAWPNPVFNSFFNLEVRGIEAHASLNVILKDALGRIIQNRKYAITAATASLKIDVASMPTGVYFYEVHEEALLLANGKIVIK